MSCFSFKGCLKLNLTASQVTEDLVTLGLYASINLHSLNYNGQNCQTFMLDVTNVRGVEDFQLNIDEESILFILPQIVTVLSNLLWNRYRRL